MSVERRVVTVLFADLVGFTSLSERLDAEDIAAIQDAYFAAVREAIGRYGGQLEKFIGDAAMAVFGVPRARDDDAERAVRAGLALIAAVEGLAARLALDDDGLRLRVGLDTGEVVHMVDGADAGRVTGDTVNTAARLQAAAAPGTVLVGDDTALAVTEAIEVEPVAALALKGKALPVRAWQVAAVRPQRSRESAMGALRAPTIGRDGELTTLASALADIQARPHVERWLVLAPPGVGKTRLLDEFAARAATMAPRPLVWRTRLRPETAGPFDPLRPLARAALADAGVEAGDRGRAVKDTSARLAAAGLVPSRAVVVAAEVVSLGAPGPSEPSGGSGPTDRSALFAAWLEGLDGLASDRTQLWLVEDLHWAGPDVIAFLEAATAHESAVGRLVLATARPSFIATTDSWAVDDAAAGQRALELATLPTRDSISLLHELVGDALPDGLVERIAERSDGNCLFIEELLRTWVGTGALVRLSDPVRWRLTLPAEEIPLPSTVQAIYAGQLDDLPRGAREAARRGAVAGRRFPARALGALGVVEPDRAVDDLRRRALVAGPLADEALGDTFAYRHALLRDAAYASLARLERADLHARLARWLEAAAGPDADTMAAAIGAHLASALASAPALAPEVAPSLSREACADQAAAWLERAGARAFADGAGATAANHFRHAIASTRPDLAVDRSRRSTLLGRALAPIGGVSEAMGAFHEAVDAARAGRDAGDARWRSSFARASAELGTLLFEQLRFLEAWHQGDEALAEMGDRDDLDTALVRLARSRGRTGETNDARGWVEDAERALAAARAADDPDLEWDVARDLARARSEAGLATLEEWRELGAQARARGDVGLEVSARTMETAWRMATAPAEVPAILRPARELALARGLVERLGWVEHAEAEAALAAGDWALAVEAGLRAVRLGERHGYDRIAVRAWSALLPAASLRGERAVLDEAAAWFAARAGQLPDSPYGRMLYAGASLWLGWGGAGRLEIPALDRLEASLALWLDEGSYEWLAAADAVLDAWFATGREAWVETALGHLGKPTTADVFRPAVLAADLQRARLAGRAGGVGSETAAGVVRVALAESRTIGLPWWIARGLRVLEELGLATDDETAERSRCEASLGVVRPALAG